jgi:membrane protease YdiL (CAAX protease family)
MRPAPPRPDLTVPSTLAVSDPLRVVALRPWPAATWSLVETAVVFFMPFGLVLYVNVLLAGIVGLHDDPGTVLLLTLAQEVALVGPVLWWMRVTGHGGIERMGLRRGQFFARDIWSGVAMGIGLVFASGIVTVITISIVNAVTGRSPTVSGLDRTFPGHWLYPGSAIAVLVAPICEEFLFRGFLFQGLRRRWSFWPAALVSGSLFAILHGEAIRLPALTVAGVILASAYEQRRTLVASITTHLTLNIIAVAATLAFR